MNAPVEKKLARGEFKCFHCRKVFPGKDGDWFDWDSMQVHLCKSCEKATAKAPQRAKTRRA